MARTPWTASSAPPSSSRHGLPPSSRGAKFHQVPRLIFRSSEQVEERAPGCGTHAKLRIAALHTSGATSGSGPGGGSLPGPHDTRCWRVTRSHGNRVLGTQNAIYLIDSSNSGSGQYAYRYNSGRELELMRTELVRWSTMHRRTEVPELKKEMLETTLVGLLSGMGDFEHVWREAGIARGAKRQPQGAAEYSLAPLKVYMPHPQCRDRQPAARLCGEMDPWFAACVAANQEGQECNRRLRRGRH